MVKEVWRGVCGSMSGSNRGGLFAFVTASFLFLLLLLYTFFIWSLASENSSNVKRQVHNSAQYAAAAEKQIEQNCLVLESDLMAKCIIDVIKSTNEHDRDERDLVAQTQMALWALGMLIVSALMFIVTAIGAWWVRGTLLATRKAVESSDNVVAVSKETMERQLRAYAFVDFEKTSITLPGIGKNLGCDIFIGVSGQTPAYNMRGGIHFDAVCWPIPEDFDFFSHPFVRDKSVTMLVPNQSGISYSAGGLVGNAELINALKEETAAYLIWGWFKYEDVFNKTRDLKFAFYSTGENVTKGKLISHPAYQQAT